MTPFLWVALPMVLALIVWLARPAWQRREAAPARFDDMTQLPQRPVPVLAIGALVATLGVLVAMNYRLEPAASANAPRVAMRPPIAPKSMVVDPALLRAEARVAAIVDHLAQRLAARPDDADGWHTLATSYAALGRHAQAVEAFGKASRLRPDDATLLAEYAAALVARDPDASGNEALRLLGRALKLDPRNPKALQLAGMLAIDGKAHASATSPWPPLARIEPNDSAVGKLRAFGAGPAQPVR